MLMHLKKKKKKHTRNREKKQLISTDHIKWHSVTPLLMSKPLLYTHIRTWYHSQGTGKEPEGLSSPKDPKEPETQPHKGFIHETPFKGKLKLEKKKKIILKSL